MLSEEAKVWTRRELKKILGVSEVEVATLEYLAQVGHPDGIAAYLRNFTADGDCSDAALNAFAISWVTKFGDSDGMKRVETIRGPFEDSPPSRSAASTRPVRTKPNAAYRVYRPPGQEAPPAKAIGAALAILQSSDNEESSAVSSAAGSESSGSVGVVPQRGRKTVGVTGPVVETAKSVRARCECMASEHKLVGNCITCGRIVCELEGAGPCEFCGYWVGVPVRTKEGREFWKEYHNMEGYTAAREMADKLLKLDSEAARRMQVFDMETDFYHEKDNPWLTDQDRQYAAEMLERQERNEDYGKSQLGKLTIDVQQKKLVLSDVQREFEAEQARALAEFLQNQNVQFQTDNPNITGNHLVSNVAANSGQRVQKPTMAVDICSPLVDLRDVKVQAEHNARTADLYNTLMSVASAAAQRRQPAAREAGFRPASVARRFGNLSASLLAVEEQEEAESLILGRKESSLSRLDPTIQLLKAYKDREMDAEYCTSEFGDAEDEGVCISLHQPWASLMVYGFKRLEGRKWTSPYRGRLWIHAASKECDPKVVQRLEAYYDKVYGGKDEHPPFPAHYPTSALVGCVDLLGFFPRGQITEMLEAGHPDVLRNGHQLVSKREGETSPHMMLCKAPKALVVPVHMSGHHKIWYIPKQRLSSIRKGLRPVFWARLNPMIESRALEDSMSEDSELDEIDLIQEEVLPDLSSALSPRVNLASNVVLQISPARQNLAAVISGCLSSDSLANLRAECIHLLHLGKKFKSLQRDESGVSVSLGLQYVDGKWVEHDSTLPTRWENLFGEIAGILRTKLNLMSTVGGPHLPELEAAQIFMSESECFCPNPVGNTSAPNIAIVLKGSLTLLLQDPANLEAGDGICWNADSECLGWFWASAGGLLLVLRSNCWL